MKLRMIRRARLVSAPREMPEGVPLNAGCTCGDQRREALYAAIEGTWSYLHGDGTAEEFKALLRQRYPAPQYFLESSAQSLERFGMSRLDAFYYSLIPAMTRTGLSQHWGPNPGLDSLKAAGEYVRTLFVGVHVERCYLVMLDGRGRLIRSALLQRGAVDNAPFYLEQVLTVTLQEEAQFLVLAHNHPGGTRSPSREDIVCTLRTINACTPLQVSLLDHLIVAADEVVSIRQAGLIPAMLWRAAQPGNRIVENWPNENLNNS